VLREQMRVDTFVRRYNTNACTNRSTWPHPTRVARPPRRPGLRGTRL